MEVFIIVIYIYLTQVIRMSQTCNAKSDPLPMCEARYGRILENALITRKTDISFLCCTKACDRMPRCSSINYYHSMKLCDINYGNRTSGGHMVLNKHGLYVDCAAWIPEEGCENKGSIGSTVDCGLPETVSRAKCNVTHGTGLWSKVIYTCNPGYTLIGNAKISCLKNQTWSKHRFKCKLIGSSDKCSTCLTNYTCDNSTDVTLCVRYYFLKGLRGQSEYRNVCKSDGGELIRITNESKQRAVQNFLQTKKPWSLLGIWIQGKDPNGTNQWYFQDDTPMNYTNFDDHGSTSGSGVYQLVVIRKPSLKWFKKAASTYRTIGALCDYPLN